MDRSEARYALGNRIRALRKGQKLSVREFALMVGLNKDYIVDLEYGRKSPTFDTILKICSGLGVTPSELMDGIGPNYIVDADAPSRRRIVNYYLTSLQQSALSDGAPTGKREHP